MIGILLVRHGETEWNAQGLLQGWKDSPLTERGIRQVRALQERLRNEVITHAVTSDLGRAIQTTSIIMEGRPLPVLQSFLVRERNYGLREGTSATEWAAERARLARERGEELIPEEGESRAAVRLRTQEFIDGLQSLTMGDRLLLVGHSHWNRQFVSELLDIPESNWGLLTQSHAGLTALVRDTPDSPWRCLYMDDTSHLDSIDPE